MRDSASNWRVLWLVLLVSGCGSSPIGPGPSQQGGLQPWVEHDLAPYLASQLSRHPRFDGQPVVIVKLDGADVQPEIDGLTRDIREQVRGALLDTRGVTLPWRPSQREPKHHRRLAHADCRNLREANYVIGIETRRSLSGEYRVSVRALDPKARQWVSGFGKTWQGELTPAERRAMQERQPDEALRGLRVLPFASDQTDLAADYLANNLSCLLQQRDQEDLVIKVEADPGGPELLPRLLGLIGNNLSRYREVRISDQRAEANFVLRGEAHELRSGLYQVWVVLNPAGSGKHMVGMDTATYLDLTESPYLRTAATERPARIRPSPATEPRVRRLELVPRAGGGYGLTVAVEDAENLFLIAHSQGEGVTRLYPDRCTAMALTGEGRYRIRELPFSGEATVYAIAVRGGEPSERLARHLDRLPGSCSRSSVPELSGVRLERWLQRLDRLVGAHRGQLAWSAQRTP